MFEGPVVWTEKKTKNWTELDQLGPDWWLRLPAFQNKKTAKKPVAMVLGTPLKSAHFENILKKIGPEMHVLQQNNMLQWNLTLYDIS